MEPAVFEVELGVEWEPNATEPVLLRTEGLAVLLLNPHFDDPDARSVVVVWQRCVGALLGPPNDEARSGHPLWAAGLNRCLWAGEVTNSPWIHDLERRNSVHPHHNPATYERLRHFILLLKDSTFECLADDYHIDRLAGSVPELVAAVAAIYL